MTFTTTQKTLLLSVGLLLSLPAAAAEVDSAPSAASATDSTTNTTEQVVVPEVTRRDIQVQHLPSNDFEVGTYVGTYSTQNFGSSLVTGLRLGYHITEDFFAEFAYAKTKVRDTSYRQILPGGIFPEETQKLSYYNLSAGYNILPGEIFIGSYARPSALYLIAGIGSTRLTDRRLSTINFGSGFRVYPSDHVALQIDAREHLFSFDILGKRESLHNLELSLGLTVSF